MYELRLPDLGEGVAEGEIVRWLVSVGQEVAEDDPLVEIQTDKATVEVPSPAAGTVTSILAAEGELIPVGRVLVVIGGADEDPTAPSPAAVPPRVQATPAVRRLAAELGVDLERVAGAGPITERAVREAAGGAGSAEQGRRVPLRGVRRSVAEHMARSHREVPAVTVVEECDMSTLDARRGPRSYLPYVLEAAAHALRAHPGLNARVEGSEILELDRIDLGVAVQTPAGLVVPVVRAADTKPVDRLADEIEELRAAAEQGTLEPEQLRGSTFTVTSAGRLGGLFATPLVNHPEVAILGLHRVGPRPWVADGALVVRPVGWLSCTFDHRAVDGAAASAFLLDVIERLRREA